MTPDYHSDDFATARLDDAVTLRSAAREARATLYAVLNRLETNDLNGDEQPFIDDCSGAIVRMSSILIGVGQRMLSVRSKLGYPQSKIAAILGIADKSYKNYELEKRELPLSIAVKFCEEFDENLAWLVYGLAVPDSQRSAELAGETARAVFEHIKASDKEFSGAEIQKFAHYIFEQSLSKDTSPQGEAKLFFSAIG